MILRTFSSQGATKERPARKIYNTIQYNIQYNTIQYTIQYNVQYNTIQYNTILAPRAGLQYQSACTPHPPSTKHQHPRALNPAPGTPPKIISIKVQSTGGSLRGGGKFYKGFQVKDETALVSVLGFMYGYYVDFLTPIRIVPRFCSRPRSRKQGGNRVLVSPLRVSSPRNAKTEQVARPAG